MTWLRTLTCAAALLLPAASLATDAPVIGFLSSAPLHTRPTPGPLERELSRRNPRLAARYHYRFAEGETSRLPHLAAGLVSLSPSLIFCADFAAATAAAQATASIPIVFLSHVDPIEHKFLESLRSSRRNITGVTTFRPVLVKLAEVAVDAAPKAKHILAVLDLSELAAQQAAAPLRQLAQSRGLRLSIHDVSKDTDLRRLLSMLQPRAFDAAIIPSSTPTWQHRQRLVAALNGAAIPAVYEAPIFLAEGGLISYGPTYDDVVPRAAEYVERILSGENPSSLPVLQPSRLELVVNLRSARSQSLTLPGILLQRADRILE